MKLLEEKIALITGGSRGIGKAIALRYASEGARVAFTCTSLNDSVLNTVKEIEAAAQAAGVSCEGPICNAYEGNIADFARTEEIVKSVIAEFGRIDILVSNAGTAKDGLMMRMSEEMWDSVINVNLKGAYNVVHAVIPYMARQRSGSIIGMSSVVGVGGNAGQANYAASKAGLIGLMRSISKEMGARGIRANCIAPGFIDTDMTTGLNQEYKDYLISTISLKRIGKPEEVAGAALFLGSDLSSYITGQTISVCGGILG